MEIKKRPDRIEDTWVEVFDGPRLLRIFTGVAGPEDKRILVMNDKNEKFWIQDWQEFNTAVDTLIQEVREV